MDWDNDLSNSTKTWMHLLGRFSPTVNVGHKLVKGYMDDGDGGGSTYFDSGELRELALACNDVADWLDKRAESV